MDDALSKLGLGVWLYTFDDNLAVKLAGRLALVKSGFGRIQF